MADNSQTITWNSSGAAQAAESAGAYADTIVIANYSGQAISVRSDGTAAVVGAAGTVEIANATIASISNGQAFPNSNVTTTSAAKYYCGVDGANDQSEAINWTAQTGYANANAWSSGYPNYVSIIPAASTSGTVTVTFQ
jgi:hypothetical protein